MEERLDNRGDEPSTTQPSQPEKPLFSILAKNCHLKMGSFLLSDMGISFQSQLKLEPFVILFSYNIVISVIIFVLISLLRQQCCKKIGRQMAQL